MAIVIGAGHSISLDSVGCFRSEIANACGEKSCASLRRWHGKQVKTGRLKEGQHFVVVRQAPDEKHHDDDVFYFLEAIKICQSRRPGKSIDMARLNLKTLRQHGLKVVEDQVVRREQLSIFAEVQQDPSENRFSEFEANNSDVFSAIVWRKYNRVKIPQRRTDGYIHADKLCQSGDKRWSEFRDQFHNPDTELGNYLLLLVSKMQTSRSILIQKLQNFEAGLRGTWIHPRVAHRVAQEIDQTLSKTVDLWSLDIAGEVQNFNSTIFENILDKIDEVDRKIDKVDRKTSNLLLELKGLKGEQLQQSVFNNWNYKINYHTEGKISLPLKHWKVFKSRPTKATRTDFPFVYIIIAYPQHELQGHPDILYVGISGGQPSDRFSNHDGLISIEALEKYGYRYEVRYYESNLFQIPGELQITEKAIQAALKPYWEYLTPGQRTLIRQGKLVVDGLFTRLYTRGELSKVS